MTVRSLAVLGVVLLAASGCAARQPGRTPAREHIVRMSAFRFVPDEISIAEGDRVTWVNDDRFIHTTVADSGAWQSAELPPQGRFTAPALPAGRHPYHCSAHPTMRGLVYVRASPRM